MIKIEIACEDDVIVARLAARKAAIAVGLSLIDQTRIITAVSELARNIVLYAGSGWMEYEETVDSKQNKGLKFIFSDRGPGINDISLAMTPGYSSGQGLGLGLSGAKRLMDEFKILSTPGKGTVIEITKWLR